MNRRAGRIEDVAVAEDESHIGFEGSIGRDRIGILLQLRSNRSQIHWMSNDVGIRRNVERDVVYRNEERAGSIVSLGASGDGKRIEEEQGERKKKNVPTGL